MKILFSLFVVLAMTSCITNSPNDTQSKELIVVGRLNQSCPIAVKCDENFEYHAFSGDIDSLNLYLSFNPTIVNDKSSANILAAFTYLYYKFSFPSLKTDSSTFYVTSPALFGRMNNSSTYNSEVTKYENGKLYGTITFSVKQLTERVESRSENCYSGDILGICYRTKDLENQIDYTIKYELDLRD